MSVISIQVARSRQPTANLRTKLLGVRGFESSITLILRGGVPRPVGYFPESLTQAMSVGVMLVGRLGIGQDVCDMFTA